MTLLYFAWVRERIGIEEERIALPASVRDVAGLLSWLKTRGPHYAKALEKPEAIRVAVNQEHARPDHALRDEDEVALFPPVTGGGP
jgi:sulfur-carrier protein